MKKQFNLKIMMLALCMLVFLSNETFAQKSKEKKTKKEKVTIEVEVDGDKTKKKVIVVKKIKGKDGKVKVERIEKEGEEATKYLKEMKITDEDGEVIDIDVNVDMNNIEINGKDVEIIEIEELEDLSDELREKLEELDINIDILEEQYEIIELEGNDHQVRVMELGGDHNFFEVAPQGDHLMIMPKDGEGANIQTIDVSKDGDQTSVTIKMDGETKKFSWEGKEIPEDVKKEMDEMGLEVKEDMPRTMTIMGNNDMIWKEKDGNVLHLNGGENAFFFEEDNHLMITPTEKIEDKIGNININVNDDDYELEFDLDGKDYEYKWKGDIPENTKKELIDMGFEVEMAKGKGDGYGAWINKMTTHNGNKAFLGVMIENNDLGVKVTDVYKESAAEEAGLQEGDIITSVAGNTVKDVEELVNALKDKKVGDKVEIGYIRGESTAKATATLKERKESNVLIMDLDEENFDYDFKFDDKAFKDLDKKMKFKFKNKGDGNFFIKSDKIILGVYTEDKQGANGVTISGTVDESGAAKAGLQKGDVIIAVDGKDVQKVGDIGKALDGKKEGDAVNIKYTRDGKTQETSVSLIKSEGTEVRIRTASSSPRFKKKNKIIIIRKKEGDEEEKELIIKKSGDVASFDNNKINVFPNPTTDQITIQFNGEDTPATISVKDVSGKEIYREEIKDFGGNYEKQVNVSDAAAGLLIVTIKQGGDVYALKVLKN